MKKNIVPGILILFMLAACTMADFVKPSVEGAVQTAVAETQAVVDVISTAVVLTQVAQPTEEPTATRTLLPTNTFTREPTLTFTLTFTKTSAAPVTYLPTAGCPLQSQIMLGNRTGTTAVFTLVGPATFYFTVQPDIANVLQVCEGCYDVFLASSACGDASGGFVGRICDGFDGWFYCGGG